MKIKCEYCGNTFNDTEDKCPFCGSPNANVVRGTKEQPVTIEELKEWYKSKGLPPYETTRFFIGIDYKEPRAFGIYKDEATDEFVVYKNKDTGERAVRYRGTDEAYAVNELFMRLKQEIIQQKMNNVKKASGERSMPSESSGNSLAKGIKGIASTLGGFAILMAVGAAAVFALIIIVGLIVNLVENEPNQGYYSYQNATYYYDTDDYKEDYYNWYCFDDSTQEWTGPIYRDDMDTEMRKNKTAKAYFLQSDWDDSLNCSDFSSSTLAADIAAGFYVAEGYYNYNDYVFYHLDDSYDSGWYWYNDGNWPSIASTDLPEEMQHTSEVSDFYYTPTWDSSTQITDFTDTQEYKDAVESKESESNDSDDSDYSWSSSDSWDSSSSDWGSDW